MPVIHVVTFTFAPEGFEVAAAALAAALDDFAPRSNAVHFYHGADLGLRDGNAHYAVTAIFDDQQAFDDYIANPEHQQIVRDKIKPYVRARSAVQFPSRG